jgi:hypothetical protein
MTTYWMHIGPYFADWYIYKVDEDGVVHAMDMFSRQWSKTKFSPGYPGTADGYAQVPDSVVVLMGVPL